jgi:hypothetical protein
MINEYTGQGSPQADPNAQGGEPPQWKGRTDGWRTIRYSREQVPT